MAHKFKPGDKVICIEFHPDEYFGGMYSVEKETILTIRDTIYHPVHKRLFLYFEEIDGPKNMYGKEYAYDGSHFAPYTPPRERIVYVSVSETLKEQVKELQPSN